MTDPEDHLRSRVAAQLPNLRRYARALTRDVDRADDLVQETVVRALSRLHLFQPDTNLRAWLFTMLHNQHVNGVRRAVKTGATVEIAAAEGYPELVRSPSQEDRRALIDVKRALDALPREMREVIVLASRGLSYDGVAEELNLPVGTVRSRLSRGREALRVLSGAKDFPVDGKLFRARSTASVPVTALSDDETAFMSRL